MITWMENKQLKVGNNQKDGWKQTTELIREDLAITEADIVKSNYISNIMQRKKTMEYQKKKKLIRKLKTNPRYSI